MTKRRLRKKYSRTLRAAAVIVVAVLGVLIGAALSFILHDYTPSKVGEAEQTIATSSAKAATATR